MAATVEGVFRIVDRATPTLAKIEAKTNSLERSLERAGRRMDEFAVRSEKDMKVAEDGVNRFTRASDKMSARVQAGMVAMARSISGSTSKGQRDLAQLQASMAAVDAQTVNPKIDVDIAKAMAQLAILKRELESINNMDVSPTVGTSRMGGGGGAASATARLFGRNDNERRGLIRTIFGGIFRMFFREVENQFRAALRRMVTNTVNRIKDGFVGRIKRYFGRGGEVTEALDETNEVAARTPGLFRQIGDNMASMGRKLASGGGYIMRITRVLLALSPALEGVLAGLMAITASLSSGIMGGLVGLTGILGTGLVGGAGALGGIIPVSKDIGLANKALDNYTKAIREHGKASEEAAEARKIFMSGVVDGEEFDRNARAIVSKWRNFTKNFEEDTEPGRNAVFRAFDQGVSSLNRRFRPEIAGVVNSGSRGFESFTGSLISSLDSPIVSRNLDVINKTFLEVSPMVGNIFGNFTSMITNIVAAAQPQVIEFFKWLNEWMSNANNNTSNLAQLGQTFDRWTGDFKIWMGFFAEFGRFFTTLFSAGRQQGTDLIRDLTEEMEAQRKVWETPMGQQGLDNWYDRQVSNFRKLTREISALVGQLGSFIDLLSRALGPVLDLSNAIRDLIPGNTLLDSLGSIATIAALFSGAKVLGGRAVGAAGSGLSSIAAGIAGGIGTRAAVGDIGDPKATKFGRLKAFGKASLIGTALIGGLDMLGQRQRSTSTDLMAALSDTENKGDGWFADAQAAIGNAINSDFALPVTSMVFGGKPMAESNFLTQPQRDSDAAAAMKSDLEALNDAEGRRLRLLRRSLRTRAEELRFTRDQKKVLEDIIRQRELGSAATQFDDLQGARRIMLNDLMGEGMNRADAMKKVNQRYRTDTLDLAQQLNPEDPAQRGLTEELLKPYKNNESVMNAVEKRFSRMGRNVKVINGQIATGTQREWSAIYKAISTKTEQAKQEAEDGFTKIQQAAMRSLQAMGLTPKEAAGFINANDGAGAGTQSPAKPRRNNSPASSNPDAGTRFERARGGRIPGRGLQDTVHMGDNHWAAPGEMWIANRHTERRIDAMLSPYHTSLSREINREGKPHSAPMEHATGGKIKFGRGGRRRRTNGEHSAPPTGSYPDAMGALPGLDVLAYYLKSKFGLSVTSGLRQGATTTTGNVSDHSWGGAIDVSNGVTTPQMDAAHAWLQGALGPALKQMLYRTMVGGNHYDHIHVALNQPYAGSAKMMEDLLAGKGAAIQLPMGQGMKPMRIRIKSPRVNMGGAPGAIAQRSNDLLAAGLQHSVNRKLRRRGARGIGPAAGGRAVGASMYGGPTDGVSGTVGYRGDSLPGKMAYAELGMGTLLGNLPHKHPLRISYGGKSVVARKLDIGAGGGDVNGLPRAIDLWHETANALGFGTGVGTVRVQDLGGAQNAGGYKNGGRFAVNRPTMFVAGEGNRREDVIVKPANKGSARRSGSGVQVHIGKIENHREGDIAKQVEKEFAKLGLALDTYGDEDDTWT